MEWSESISEAINYIESHITEELTIADIAKQAIISPYYFQKGFSMLCGFTVGEYIKRRRLTLAGSEIVSTDRKIIDIALEYGYPFSVRGQTIFLDSCSLAAALAELPEQSQEEIFLYYFQHLKQKEIGEQSGWTRSTIGRHT